MGLLREKTAKKNQKKSSQKLAQDFLGKLWLNALNEKISVNKRLFLKPKTSDDLLVLMGLNKHSGNHMSYNVLQCIKEGFSADQKGVSPSGVSQKARTLADTISPDIFNLLDSPNIEPFKKGPSVSGDL